MIWNDNVELVVMLTQIREGGRSKCAPYWPRALGECVEYGDFSITNTAVEHDDEYQPKITTSTLTLEKASCGDSMVLRHVQYLAWPDHGVPDSPDKFAELVEHVKALQMQVSESSRFTLLHCSAGIGRTGVFMATSVMVEKLRKGLLPDGEAVLKELRQQRMNLVQTPEQYEFCFFAALAMLNDPSWYYAE